MNIYDQIALDFVKVIGVLLAFIVVVGTWQVRRNNGVQLWATAFLVLSISQLTREGAAAMFGLQPTFPIGHFGGSLTYMLLYGGSMRFLGQPFNFRLNGILIGVAFVASFFLMIYDLRILSRSFSILLSAAFLGMTAYAFAVAYRKQRHFVLLVAAGVFTLSSLAALARASSIFSLWWPQWYSPQTNAFWIFVSVSLNILQASSLIFLINKFLIEQVEERNEKVLVQSKIIEYEKAAVERQKHALEAAYSNIALISGIGRDITAVLDTRKIFELLYARIQALMPVNVFIVRIIKEGDAAVAPLHIRYSAPDETAVETAPDALSDWCLQMRSPLRINNAASEARHYLSPNDLAGTSSSVPDGVLLSRLYVPLIFKDKQFGVLTVQSQAADQYQPVHLDMLLTLASYVAVAFDNADAYERLEHTMAELKSTQQQLAFRGKMMSLGVLTAGVAHEINNPANFAHAGAQILGSSIRQFHAFLLALAGDDTPPEVTGRLNTEIGSLLGQVETILEGTTRIRDLVKDLRTFARLDEADRKAVPVNEGILSTVRLVRTTYEHLTTIHCDLQANPVLDCWPAQLNQVFMNLIVNACQAIEAKFGAMPKEHFGSLIITSRWVDENLLITFEDNGCGIAPEIIDRVFEPFFTTKASGEASGLGLSISYGIIEKHGGKLSVSSRVGHGTCFTIKLPRSLEVAQASQH